jgi:hypothetical protein
MGTQDAQTSVHQAPGIGGYDEGNLTRWGDSAGRVPLKTGAVCVKRGPIDAVKLL